MVNICGMPTGKGMRDVALTKSEQFRRVTLLCCHFVRNLAYYRADKRSQDEFKSADEFWITVHANFIDQCVLEWCKLFVDTKNRQPGEHRWDNVVADKARFQTELFQQIDQTQFQTLVDAMSTACNKFIAHLDDQNKEDTPHMDVAKEAVQFYHGYIVMNEAHPGDNLHPRTVTGLLTDLNDYYSARYREARKIYAL
jgi:hypothetical protein